MKKLFLGLLAIVAIVPSFNVNGRGFGKGLAVGGLGGLAVGSTVRSGRSHRRDAHYMEKLENENTSLRREVRALEDELAECTAKLKAARL